jgi:ABC-type uncharacterized transport system ATPase subunit
MNAEQLLVALRGIVKEFPGVRANDGVDFELEAGEIHALLGENGAGKTTLMNVLSGLLRPDAGTIEILGDDSAVRSPRAAIDRGIGMVHQHFRLVDRFTVAASLRPTECRCRRTAPCGTCPSASSSAWRS